MSEPMSEWYAKLVEKYGRELLPSAEEMADLKKSLWRMYQQLRRHEEKGR